MAGRPKRRAKLAALAQVEVAAAPRYLPPEDPMALFGGEPASEAGFSALDVLAERKGAAPLPSDRELLGQWWRDQVEYIEHTSDERRELLREAADADGEIAHPSPIFARQAKMFGALGIPRDVVAVLLEISEGELQLHYGAEYQVGSAEVVSQVAANLLRIATSTNDRVAVKAAIEVMNRRGGEEWRAPAQKIELDDARKPKGNLIDSSRLTYEDRQLLRGVIERSMNRRVAIESEVPADDPQ